jgi:hypothetical protein
LKFKQNSLIQKFKTNTKFFFEVLKRLIIKKLFPTLNFKNTINYQGSMHKKSLIPCMKLFQNQLGYYLKSSIETPLCSFESNTKSVSGITELPANVLMVYICVVPSFINIFTLLICFFVLSIYNFIV